MTVIYEFDPQIYPRKVWITIGATESELKEVFSGDVATIENSYATCHYVAHKKQNKGGVLIVFNKRGYMDNATITHESAHSAMMIFEYIGACRNIALCQEPYCYLTEWVAKCCYDVKNKKVQPIANVK